MGEFDRMISSTDETEPVVDEQLQITGEEYVRWEKEIAAIKIHYSIFEVIHALKTALSNITGKCRTRVVFQLLSMCPTVAGRRW